ncbi:ORF054 [Saltwater crocodilepox virus]|nr:hypothetical protein [Saltwater crocodilepox virus]QGT47137.1 ORF054 [Saltwater crocodilepox virus]QGT47781.1 ORF054 [Saltwater crocodilepox virus]QGT47992.1 ORF054 [Saltwater crocodilepox virus]QGT48847.1 ORF054 [Saltwater crocodilepox virus]
MSLEEEESESELDPGCGEGSVPKEPRPAPPPPRPGPPIETGMCEDPERGRAPPSPLPLPPKCWAGTPDGPAWWPPGPVLGLTDTSWPRD